MLPVILQGIGSLCGIVSLVCFIMVLVQMFKRGESTMGIVCIVTIFCCVGGLIAFIYGWTKAGAWDIKNLMIAWTIAIVVGSVFNGIGYALAMKDAVNAINQGQFEVDPGDMNFDMPEGFDDMPEGFGQPDAQ